MHTRREAHRLRDVENTARRDAARSQMIPRTQLFDGDAKTVGDRDKRIGVTHGVTLLAFGIARDSGDRNN